jgi:hypothetical protein
LKRLRLSDGGTVTEIEGTPLRSELLEALARYERAARPAELSQLLRGLAVLAAATIRKEPVEHGVVVEATRAYAEALSRFPGDIALAVVEGWPASPHGRWWPSLHDLIAACQTANEERVRAQDAIRRALRSARPGDDDAGPTPVGRTERFFQRVAAARGPLYAFTWLNRRNCRFTEQAVLTTALGAGRLQADVGTIAAEAGVEIMEGARFATDGDHGDAEPAPIRRLRDEEEDLSDEERAERVAELRAIVARFRGRRT